MKKTLFVTCRNDQDTERFGFLWLKKRMIKVNGITQGKKYPVVTTLTNIYSHKSYSYFIIVDDNKLPQIVPLDRFNEGDLWQLFMP
jgi:hypothetical protein